MEQDSDLQRCISILRQGGLIVSPSDTVYGLLCDATNEQAVRKLIEVKNRPWGKPISVFVDGFEMMESIVETAPNLKQLKALLPGPFTVILPSKHTVCSLLESESGMLGVRLPAYPWLQKLVEAYGKPLTATSANISGHAPHYRPEGFIKELSPKKRALIDYVVMAGKLPHNKPSTIIDFSRGTLHLLRVGDIVPKKANHFISHNAQETKKIAAYLAEKYAYQSLQHPVVFMVEGEMGAGKTVFAQGVGSYLGIEQVVSPTYVVYYEYKAQNSWVDTFLHADLYAIEESNEFEHLGLKKYLKEKVMICIEWGVRMGPLFEEIKKTAAVVLITIAYKTEKMRTIEIAEMKE